MRQKLLDALKHSHNKKLEALFIGVIKAEKEQHASSLQQKPQQK